jgi:hypothetical protein
MGMFTVEERDHARGRILSLARSDPFIEALVRSLDQAELRRALAVATACFISELKVLDPTLSARLEPLLQQFGST